MYHNDPWCYKVESTVVVNAFMQRN